ncbi:hypothetical protein [Pajaroellobacter abortibovis]|uniref:hypothetical protein n=1 Tax=Pajaroellobacter abortibovis TaxID=1882918 RepID=UPI0015607AE8|nr:hypothetical protein [Pajaroellobacter abortibovis]
MGVHDVPGTLGPDIYHKMGGDIPCIPLTETLQLVMPKESESQECAHHQTDPKIFIPFIRID